MTREKAGRICGRARAFALIGMVLCLLGSCPFILMAQFTAIVVMIVAAVSLYMTAAFFAALRALVDPAEPDDQWKKSDNFVQL